MAIEFKIRIENTEQAAKEVAQLAMKSIDAFSHNLYPIIRDRSPWGAGAMEIGMKHEWLIQKTQQKGTEIWGGLYNKLPYVNIQNVKPLRHLRGMEGSKKWERGFGEEFGDNPKRKAWAAAVYGSDTKKRKYSRGYRRAIEQGAFSIFPALFIDTAIQEIGGRVLGKEQKGGDWIYYIDYNAKI